MKPSGKFRAPFGQIRVSLAAARLGAAVAGALAAGVATSPKPARAAEGLPTSPAPKSSPAVLKAPPALEVIPGATFHLGGPMGERIDANTRNWLMEAPASNPAMLQIFRDRDRTPRRDLVPWAGEFAGKYLISCVQAMRLDHVGSSPVGEPLARHLAGFVADLIATQDADGYLGPFPKDARMTGPGLWDLWGQYHVMLGLYLYAKQTGDAPAMAACLKCADYFCATFLDGGKRVVQAGSEEMNESSIHVFMLLYEETGNERYLRLAREIEKDWEVAPSGDYVRTALAGVPYYKTPKPRWEGLHSVQAISELYFVTGDEKYKKAYEQIYTSIRDGDRHNTGGFSSGEQATGNPYDPRPIETCCTIAWMNVARDWLRISGDSRVADELELSTWNAVAGAQSPTGRWWTYNTPMDGERKASAHDIVFQARAGSPELNCCSVNGPRGLGMISEWAVMRRGEGVALNYYGPDRLSAPLAGGGELVIEQTTAYPFGYNGLAGIVDNNGLVEIAVRGPDRPVALWLRIPAWSTKTVVRVDDEEIKDVKPGEYLKLERVWNDSAPVTIELDMTPQIWIGERESAGKFSVRRGPILLAYDPRLDKFDSDHLPALSPDAVRDGLEIVAASDSEAITDGAPMYDPLKGLRSTSPLLTVRVPAPGGESMILIDFATAGSAGNRYVTWLPKQ